MLPLLNIDKMHELSTNDNDDDERSDQSTLLCSVVARFVRSRPPEAEEAAARLGRRRRLAPLGEVGEREGREGEVEKDRLARDGLKIGREGHDACATAGAAGRVAAAAAAAVADGDSARVEVEGVKVERRRRCTDVLLL